MAEIKHPMLVAKIFDDYIEVIALDKTYGKMHQLYKPYNYYINSENPKETVIFEDSYAQLNTKITIERDDCLLNSRKTNDCLSKVKLDELLKEYDIYQKENKLLEERIVHMSLNEILSLNEDLNEYINC